MELSRTELHEYKCKRYKWNPKGIVDPLGLGDVSHRPRRLDPVNLPASDTEAHAYMVYGFLCPMETDH